MVSSERHLKEDPEYPSAICVHFSSQKMTARTIFDFLVLVFCDPDSQTVPLRLVFQLGILGSVVPAYRPCDYILHWSCSQPYSGHRDL